MRCFAFLATFALGKTDRDLYEILDIPRSASTSEIKSAYKTIAREYHPDKNEDPEAVEIFQEAAYAKEILTDEHLRERYDSCGHPCLEDAPNTADAGDFPDILQGFFNFPGQEQNAGPQRGDDVFVPLSVTLEEMYNGAEINYVRRKLVPETAPGTRKCNCQIVMKQVQQGMMIQMVQEEVCEQCQNIKWEPEEDTVEIEIQRGMPDGQVLFLEGEGEQSADGPPGDLKFVLHELPHPVFDRKAENLFLNVTISLQDALTGFETEATHLDGRNIKIKRTGITRPEFRQKLANEGMPKYGGGFGFLLITFDIDFPTKILQEDEKLKISEIFKTLE